MSSAPRMRLAAAAAATKHQKEWFLGLRDEHPPRPLALVNADAPQEIFRALDITYVVNQWWASIIAAKRQSTASLAALAGLGYPDYSRQYDALALGEQHLEAEQRPWGGLPKPSLVVAELSDDAAGKVFDVWQDEHGVEFFPFERPGLDPAPDNWWELVPERWEEAYGPARLDLMQAEIELLIARAERLAGRDLDLDRLREVMRLSNEQAELNRSTRDLIARAPRLPVDLDDVIPAVMVPQWHRGSQWAVDAARRLNTEVREAIEREQAVCAGESRRLMWIGRGVWGDLDLYRAFEQSHRAVFVWSMYLAIAADGYVRYGADPVRALAARFTGLTDSLYSPPWSTQWYVKEARESRVQGVVNLVADDVPASHFTTLALETAGIPVLELRANNADARTLDPQALRSRIADFLDERVPAHP